MKYLACSYLNVIVQELDSSLQARDSAPTIVASPHEACLLLISEFIPPSKREYVEVCLVLEEEAAFVLASIEIPLIFSQVDSDYGRGIETRDLSEICAGPTNCQ